MPLLNLSTAADDSKIGMLRLVRSSSSADDGKIDVFGLVRSSLSADGGRIGSSSVDRVIVLSLSDNCINL